MPMLESGCVQEPSTRWPRERSGGWPSECATASSSLQLAAAFGSDWTFGIPLLSRPGMPRTNFDGRDLQSRGARGRAPYQARGTCARLSIIAEARAYCYGIQQAIETVRNDAIAL
jgi:hypothetical protein